MYKPKESTIKGLDSAILALSGETSREYNDLKKSQMEGSYNVYKYNEDLRGKEKQLQRKVNTFARNVLGNVYAFCQIKAKYIINQGERPRTISPVIDITMHFKGFRVEKSFILENGKGVEKCLLYFVDIFNYLESECE